MMIFLLAGAVFCAGFISGCLWKTDKEEQKSTEKQNRRSYMEERALKQAELMQVVKNAYEEM